MTSIPVDFTTQGSTPVPRPEGVTCSCGKKAIGQCNCEKVCPSRHLLTIQSAVENPRCSCGKNAAGECNCERAPVENEPLAGKATCSCGMRAAGACTCSHVCLLFFNE